MLNHSCAPNAIVMFMYPGASGGLAGSGSVQLKVRSIRRIQPGEEIRISYIGLAQPCSSRRKELLTNYYFMCHCEACEAASSDDDGSKGDDVNPLARAKYIKNKSMDAIKCQHAWKKHPGNIPTEQSIATASSSIVDALERTHLTPDSASASASPAAFSTTAATAATASPSSSSSPSITASSSTAALIAARCDGILLSNPVRPDMPLCSQCGLGHNLSFIMSRMDSEVLPLMERAQVAVRALSEGQGQSKDSTSSGGSRHTKLLEARKYLDAALAALSTVHAPPAFPLLTCLDQLLTTCVDLGEWAAAHRAVAASLPFYEAYYEGLNHPLLGLQLLTHAKLSWLLEKPSEALRSWKRALPILQVTHGPHHALVAQVREAIPPAEMEAAHERSTSRQIKA